MGAGGSRPQKLEKALGRLSVPEAEHYFGLENFGNTCYCNSVLQALYYCVPMRERCLEYFAERSAEGSEDDLLLSLCELFQAITSQRRRCGVFAPRRFVSQLRADNELFNNNLHQDAHEFLNYLLNEAAELLEKRNRPNGADKAPANGPASGGGGGGGADGGGADGGADGGGRYTWKTWIHSIFEGVLVNETRCLCCEAVTTRTESFLDLSLEIDVDSSVSTCMRNFCALEPLRGENKFRCDACCSLQEADRRIRIARLPNVLALHLKRFKYAEDLGRSVASPGNPS